MKRRPIGGVEPVSRIERQQLNFGAFGQIGWLVHDKPASLHTCLDRHPEPA